MKNGSIRGIVLAMLGPLLWGISGTLAQFLFDDIHVSSHWLVSVRMLISGILLVLYGLIGNHRQEMRVWHHKRDSLSLIFFSFIGMAASQYTYFMAIEAGNAATATILQFLAPAMIIIYLALWTRRFPRRIDVFSVIMALSGTVLLVTHGQLTTLAMPLGGFVWGVGAAVSSTLYTLLPRNLLKEYGSIPIVGWSMLIGGTAFSLYYRIWDNIRQRLLCGDLRHDVCIPILPSKPAIHSTDDCQRIGVIRTAISNHTFDHFSWRQLWRTGNHRRRPNPGHSRCSGVGNVYDESGSGDLSIEWRKRRFDPRM